MSEQNILNPTPTSDLNPDYTLPEIPADTVLQFQPKSGEAYARDYRVRGRTFQLHWNARQFSTFKALRQWGNQYDKGFFTYADWDDSRYYSGRFDGPPHYERMANNQVNITANFVEIPRLAMYQYPSAWPTDAKFLEERDDFNNDLVKLTAGTWDRRDRNYCLWSRGFDNAAWQKNTGVTVTANVIAGPIDTGATADRVDYNGSGSTGDFRIFQTITLPGSNTPPIGVLTTVSVWMRTVTGTLTLRLANNAGFTRTAFNLTTAWQRYSVPTSADGASISQILIYSDAANNATFSIYVSDAQVEFGNTATTNAFTTSATAQLTAPNSDASLHGGFAYWNLGTVTTDLIEWLYIGYGFRLWASKGPYMGIMQVTVDGVVQGTVDLYAAAITASAPLMTMQSLNLDEHRIGLSPTNTKNASASGFWVHADALEVMK